MSKLKKIGFANITLAIIAITLFITPKLLNPIFIAVLFLFVTLRYFFFNPKIYKQNFSKIHVLFLAYFTLILISLLYSENFNYGIKVAFSHIPFFIIPLISLFISKDEVDLGFISKYYINFLCLIFLILFIIAVYRNYEEGYSFIYFLNALFNSEPNVEKFKYFNYWYFVYDKFVEPINIQPIYLGLFTNIGVILLLFLNTYKKVKYFFPQFIILSLLVLFCGSRWQTLIFMLNYFLYVVFFHKSKYHKKVIILFLLGALITVVTLLNPVTKTRLKEALNFKEAFYEDQFGSTSIRIKKWSSAIKCVLKSPFIGYGAGDGKEALLNQFKRDKFYLAYFNKYNSHNQYLDSLLYIGLGGLLTLFMIFYYSYKWARNKMYILLITNTFVVGFITESMLNRQWGIISFVFFFVIFSTFNFKKNEA